MLKMNHTKGLALGLAVATPGLFSSGNAGAEILHSQPSNAAQQIRTAAAKSATPRVNVQRSQATRPSPAAIEKAAQRRRVPVTPTARRAISRNAVGAPQTLDSGATKALKGKVRDCFSKGFWCEGTKGFSKGVTCCLIMKKK